MNPQNLHTHTWSAHTVRDILSSLSAPLRGADALPGAGAHRPMSGFWLIPALTIVLGTMLVAPLVACDDACDTYAQRGLAVIRVPYLTQWNGQTIDGTATDAFDCGPTAVAMVVAYFKRRPAVASTALASAADRDFILQVRYATGDVPPDSPYLDTNNTQLERALTAYGLDYREIPEGLSPAPNAQLQAMRNAIAAGNPVIAFVAGTDIGRGANYYHWVVVTGFDNLSNPTTVYLNDPDTLAPASGQPGGQTSWPYSVFQRAVKDGAEAQGEPYGIEVDTPAQLAWRGLTMGPDLLALVAGTLLSCTIGVAEGIARFRMVALGSMQTQVSCRIGRL